MGETFNQPEQSHMRPQPESFIRLIPTDNGYVPSLALHARSGKETLLETPYGDFRAQVKKIDDDDLGMSLMFGTVVGDIKEVHDEDENKQFFFRADDLIVSIAVRGDAGIKYQDHLVMDRSGKSSYIISDDESITSLGQEQLLDRRLNVLFSAQEIISRSEKPKKAKAAGLLGRVAAKFQRPKKA